MRVAGALTLVAAFMAATVFFLLPTHVSVLGTTVSCGPPPIAVLRAHQEQDRASSDDIDLNAACNSEAVPRLAIGAVLLVIGGVGGTLMLTLGGPAPTRRP